VRAKEIARNVSFDVFGLSRHEVNMTLKVKFKLTVFDGYNSMLNKMLSYRRETALQGAL